MYLEQVKQIEAETDNVRKYGMIKNLMKLLEEDLDWLKPEVLPVIQELKDGNDDPDAPVAVPDIGSFNTQVRTTYEYTEGTKQKEKDLKKLKADEVRDGAAKVVSENTILVFTGPKETKA